MAGETEYPKRPKFFASKFCRLLTKTAAAQVIGADACWMLSVIVHQEDSSRYRPVTFWNGQLFPLCGFANDKKLIRVRKRAVDAGWLHYQPGGKSRVGVYWVVVPRRYANLGDGPIDEGPPGVCLDKNDSQSGVQSASCMDKNDHQSGIQTESKRNQSGIKAESKWGSSLPYPNPTPKKAAPPCRRLRFDEEDMEIAHWMFDLIRKLQPGAREPAFDGWANSIRLMREQDSRAPPDIREIFAWANADPFWQSNILSPNKLREKFDALDIKRRESGGRNSGAGAVFSPAQADQPFGPTLPFVG